MDERAVSAAVGVSLFIAIVVVLAATVATMTLAFGDELDAPTDHAGVSTDYDPSGGGNGGVAYVKIIHEGGPKLDGGEVYIRDSDGNEVLWKNVWTAGDTIEPGEYVHIDGKGSDCALNEITEDEVYRVYHAPNDSDTETKLAEVEIEDPPDSPAGPFTC